MANPVEGIDMSQSTCEQCQAPFVPPRKDSRFCSKRCGAKASRTRNARTCEVDGCSRPYGAKGMCYSHYGAWHREEHGRPKRLYDITCIGCGSSHKSTRPDGKFCSDSCKGKHYSATMKRKCKLPAGHPVMVLIAEARTPKPRPTRVDLRTPRECPSCAAWFCPVLHCAATQMVACSDRCSKRLARRRRRAREHNTLNLWRWSDFMRIARKFDYRCAYCGDKPGQLEPDHVLALSRGGADAVSNLLPSCHTCNSDKCARTLDEWADWRADRDKAPRVTSWSPSDPRFTHLAVTQPTLAA